MRLLGARRLLAAAGVVLATFSAWSRPAWAQNENETIGFQTNHVFESGQFGENIDVLNGGLSLTVPIGQSYQLNSRLGYQLVLSYSSKVWDTSAYKKMEDPQSEAVMPYNEGPFGIGFSMHFGRIYVDARYSNTCGPTGAGTCYLRTWRYVSPDGNQHEFHIEDGLASTEDPPGPPFTNRETGDRAFIRITGPDNIDCYPFGTTQCMHVQTPDGLVRTLAKRVDCLETPVNAQRRDSLSYCGWYTTLIEDQSVGVRADDGTGALIYPHHIKIAYSNTACQEHIMTTMTDSVGREIQFTTQRLGGTPGSAQCETTLKSPVGRGAFAVTSVSLPATANNAATLPNQVTTARAVYGFQYDYGDVRRGNLDYEYSTPLMHGQNVLKLRRIDYPHYDGRPGGAAADDYSLYFGYENTCDEPLGTSPRACPDEENQNNHGNGDYGEVTCRTLPVRRLPSDANPCDGVTSPVPRYRYTYWYYKYVSAFLSGARAAGKLSLGQNQFNFRSPSGSGGVNATGFTRSLNKKTLEIPAASGTTLYKWSYMRGDANSLTNPTKVVVRDPFGNDTVYQYRASPSSNVATQQSGDGVDPEDGYAPEWDDGINDRIDYYEGTETTGRLVRSEVSDYDADRQTLTANPHRHNKDNVRTNRSETVHRDDGDQKLITAYEDWDGHGHYRIETQSGFEVAPRITFRNYVAPNSVCAPPGYACSLTVYRTDLIAYEEATDGQRVLSRTDNRYDSKGNLVESIQRAVLPGTMLSPWSITAQQGDVRTVLTYSTISGNAIRKQVTTGDVADHGYTIAYGYAPAIGRCTTQGDCGGYLATKEFLNPDGSIPSVRWKAIDRDRDVNSGRPIRTRDAAGVETSYEYDGLGRTAKVSPTQEDATEIDYDSLQQTSVYQGARNSSDFIRTRYRYDGLGRLVTTYKRAANAETDGGACQKTTSDILGRVTSQSNWKYAPEAADVCSPDLNEGHQWTVYEFTDPVTGKTDPFGRIRREIPPDGNAVTGDKSVRSQYFGNSTVIEVQGVRAPGDVLTTSRTTLYRDALNRLVHVDVDSGRFCNTTLVPCTSDAQCYVEPVQGICGDLLDAAKAQYEYDALDRLVRIELTDDHLQSQVRRVGYDGVGRTTWTENPENGTTLFTKFDGLGSPLSIQDAKANVHKWTYDRAGRVSQQSVISSEGGSEKVIASNNYDESGRGSSLGKLTTVFSKDEAGVLTLTDQRTYNGVGGRLSDINYIFADWPAGIAEKVSYMYDARGQVTRITYPRETTATHDVLNLDYQYRNGYLQKALVGGVERGSLKYDASGAVSEVLTLGGGKTAITFDSRNRPLVITGGIFNAQLGWTYFSGNYQYDGAGNIWAIGSNRYGYDAVGRLIKANTEIPGSTFDESFLYDGFGNQTSHTLYSGAFYEGESRAFASPGGHPTNRVTNRYHSLAGVSSDPVAYQYDSNGNVTVGGRYELGGKELKRFQYDPANRLTTIYRVLTSGSTEYLSELDRYFYDSGANRIVKTQNGTGLRTYYLRDASGQLLSEFRRAAGETSIPEWAKDELYLGGRSFGLRENKRPGPPVGLHVSGIDPVQVEWTTNPESDVTGYNVYRRRVNLGESWGPVALGLTATAFVDEGAFPSGTNLNYQVTAVDSAGTESLTSPIAKLIVGDVTPPSKPTLGTPVAGSGQVTLSWSASSDSSGISGYEISRRASLEDPSVPITPVLVTTLNYLDVNLTNGTTYYYIVRAKDGAGNWGPYSCPSFPPGALCDKSAMPKDFVPPGPPKDFNATPLCPASGGQQFKLTWAPNPDSDNVTGYEIFRGTSPFLSSGNSVGTTTGTYYVDPSPTPGTRYYAVKALDNASPQNKSAFSDVRSGFTRDASISSAYPVTGPFAKAGDGKVTLTWDATTAPNLYRIYRKLNSFESCGDYQLVGQVAPPDLNFTDNTVSNNYAYDYSLVPVLSNAEGTFTRPALAIPLSRPGDSLEQCGREGPPTYSVKIKWAHPSTFRPYHPISANGLDAEEALFRGYHLYHYKLCGLVGEKGGGCSTAYWDNSPMRRVIVDADSVDPYLITSADASFEYVLGLTGSSDTDLWPQLVQEPGSYTAINGSDTCYPSPSSGALAGDEWDCRAATSKNCLMPRAVYDVFADGTWLSVESDWPDYWHPDEPISDQRCDAHFGTWGMTPQCWTVTTSPVAPTAVSVQATGEGQVSVSWTPGIQPGGVSVSQFYVYGQKLGGNGVPPFQRPVPYVAVGSSSSSYTFTNLPKYTIASPFTGYQFMVAAVDQFGRISSATASTHVVPSPESSSPGAPRGVRQTLWTVNDATRSDGRGRQGIKLAWTDAFVTSGAAVAGHRIYRSSTGSEPWCAFLQTGSLPSEPPLAPSLDRCEVASEALSSELTTGASVFYFWDKTAEASRNYYYRVTQVQDAGGVRTETPYTESPTLTGRALPYEPTRLPPVTGLRAWAPWNSQEKQGVNLDWCRLDASEDPGMPTIAGYNIYRTYLSGGPYHYLETVPASCLDTGKRCEIHVNPSNPVQYQVEVCDQAGANCYLPTCSESIGSCHVADRTFSGVGQRHPSPIDTPADQQTGFAFYYVVTATTSLSDPRNPANESQPSLENAGFPNYLGIGWYKRRDPDGDGDLLRDSQGNEVPLCGDQDSRFGAPGNEPGTIASAAVETGEVVEQVAPYRTIGQGSGYPPYRFLYYHLDHLGSVRVITDEAGAVVSQHHYLPFGEERPGTIDPSLNTRAFTGHERDADTGMDYMLARYYSSSLARFLSPDQGGDTQLANPQSWNKYVYTGNNPLNYVDPNGQFKILVGEYRHENVTRAALPASGGVVNRADVIRGNRGGDLHRGDLGNHLNTGGAATGSAGDTRVQHGSSQLGEALRQVAGGNTQAAGETLGNAMHSFDDLMAHGGATGGNGGDHSSPANAGNMDSSDSPGIATRFEGAVSLESSINGIFTQAATAIQAGGDADAIIAGAQEQAAQAAQGQYSSTKAQLDKNGSKPQGY